MNCNGAPINNDGRFASLRAAARRPGWAPVLGIELAAVGGALAALRWSPPAAHAAMIALAAILVAAATASLCDDRMAELASATPAPLRRRAGARLVLALLSAAWTWSVFLVGAARLSPALRPADATALGVIVIAAGVGIGSAVARLRPDVPAGLPTALILTVGTFAAGEISWPPIARAIAASAFDSSGTEVAWAAALAALVVLGATRDRAARPVSTVLQLPSLAKPPRPTGWSRARTVRAARRYR